MLKVDTKYFGELAYSDAEVVLFPAGLLGFESHRRFLLIEVQSWLPASFLQNLEDPGLCFLVMPATRVDPEFRLLLDPESRALLGLEDRPYPDDALLCLAILNFGGQGQDPAANMKAPVVIHVAARKAAQVIHYEAGYQVRHPVPALEEVLSCS